MISFATYGQINSKHYFQDSQRLFEEKKHDKALTAIDNALKTDSLNRTYLIHKVNILYNSSKCNDAMIVLNKVYEVNNEKIDDQIMVFFIALYDCLGQNEKATKILTNYIDKKQYQDNGIIINLAQRLMNEEDYENTALYYKKYLALNPHDIDAIVDLTRILYAFKSSDEAIKEVFAGLKNNKDNIRLLTYLASCYHNNKEYDKAIEIENKIIKLDYKPEHIASRAMLYELAGKKAEAYEDNKTIVGLIKCNSEYYFKVMQYEFENRMFEKVIENSHKLIACDPKNEDTVLDGLYTSLFFCGEMEKGKLYLDKKLKLKTGTFNSYYLKALVLLKEKQYSEVLKYLDLASQTKDGTPEDLKKVSILKFAYYLLIEDYQGFINSWKSGNIQSLNTDLEFAFSENFQNEKTELKVDFNKTTGVINSSLIIPTKTFKLLRDKYGLDVKIQK